MANSIPIISHYTSADAIINILKNKTLWLTRLQFMNDPIELKFVDEAILSCLRVILHEKEEAKLLTNHQCHQIYKTIHDFLLKSHLDESYWPSNYDYYFILSFSSADESLAMWQRYTSCGGYIIQFDREKLLEQIKTSIKQESHASLVKIYSHAVQYCGSETDIIKKIKKVVDDLCKSIYELCYTPKAVIEANETCFLKMLCDSYHPIDERETINYQNPIEQNFIDLLRKLFSFRTRYKHTTFSDEKEYRIVIRIDSTAIRQNVINFRSRNGLVIPYIEIDLPDIYKAIVGIGINPLFKINKAKQGIRLLLNEHRDEEEIIPPVWTSSLLFDNT